MLIKTFFAAIIYLSIPQIVQSQSMMQLVAAGAFHDMKNDPEKIKAVRKLEKDGWFAIDTFFNLDKTLRFQKSDLAPYIDDNGNTVFLVADVSPVFPGGKKALQSMLTDSLGTVIARTGDEVQKSIYIKFLVEADGSISEVEEAQQHPDWVNPELIKTCLSTLKAMPKWSPGVWKGKPVGVKMLVSVNLKE